MNTKANAISRFLYKNAALLFLVQIITYAAQFISIPFLARVLQPSIWGLVLFARAYATILAIIIEYGFNMSGTRAISQNRDNPEFVRETVKNILGTKLLLIFGSMIFTLIVWSFIPAFHAHPEFMWLAWFMVLAQGLNPFWFYQGNEKFLFPSVMNIISRIAATVCIFLWVTSPEDGAKVLLFQGTIWLAATLLSYIPIYKKVEFLIPRFKESLGYLSKNFRIFVFSSTSFLVHAANTFILGLFLPTATVSNFGSCERLLGASRAILHPLSNVVFPRVNKLFVEDKAMFRKIAKNNTLIFGASNLLISILAFLFSSQIIAVILGAGYQGAVPILRVISWVILFAGLNRILGQFWIIPLHQEKFLSRTVVVASTAQLILAFLVLPFFGAIGLSTLILIMETLVFFALLTKVFKNRSTGLYR